jgi:TetR/AcrR family transcriptional repressor of nem operon
MGLKESIIHESQKLFSLNGYLNTGINDIIEAANTSKGGFYNHFQSKEELFSHVLAEAQVIWREKVLHGVREVDSPTEKVKLILRNYQNRYLQDYENFPGGCIFITLSVELDDQRPHLMENINAGFSGFINLLQDLLEEAKSIGELSPRADAVQMANYIFTNMLGISVLYGVHKSKESLTRSIEALIECIDSRIQK